MEGWWREGNLLLNEGDVSRDATYGSGWNLHVGSLCWNANLMGHLSKGCFFLLNNYSLQPWRGKWDGGWLRLLQWMELARFVASLLGGGFCLHPFFCGCVTVASASVSDCLCFHHPHSFRWQKSSRNQKFCSTRYLVDFGTDLVPFSCPLVGDPWQYIGFWLVGSNLRSSKSSSASPDT